MPITGALERNLQLVNDTLQALVSSQEDFEMVMRQLPYQVSEACETRRGQAQRFMANFIETRVDDKTLDDEQHSPTFNPSHKLIKSNSIMAHFLGGYKNTNIGIPKHTRQIMCHHQQRTTRVRATRWLAHTPVAETNM